MKVDVKDDRLKKLFDDPDFAIDATNPEFKKVREWIRFLPKSQTKEGKEVACESTTHC